LRRSSAVNAFLAWRRTLRSPIRKAVLNASADEKSKVKGCQTSVAVDERRNYALDITYRAWLDVASYHVPCDWIVEAKTTSPQAPPWGSKERINRAGDAIRKGSLSIEEARYVDVWRASHRYVLHTFQAILRNRTRGKGIVVAQRLKRRITIADKLDREPRMQLSRMDDVAGCRLIFSDLPSLSEFRATFHKARFRHRRKNDLDKYDYIKHPKALGYHGIHDIYEYDTISKKGAPYKGLFLEIQYRTKCQHTWATSVELLTHLTGYEPKFNRGDAKHIEFFRLASEVMARTCEACHYQLFDILMKKSRGAAIVNSNRRRSRLWKPRSSDYFRKSFFGSPDCRIIDCRVPVGIFLPSLWQAISI
jgi:ppGpp synthetase/RelA/SpoT-type nucleotidyltranferase